MSTVELQIAERARKFNGEALHSLFKWLNRRGGKIKLNWKSFSDYVGKWTPLLRPFIKHSYRSL